MCRRPVYYPEGPQTLQNALMIVLTKLVTAEPRSMNHHLKTRSSVTVNVVEHLTMHGLVRLM
jgi:hypothetical protein